MADDVPDVPLFADLNDNDPALVAAATEAKRTLRQFVDATSNMRFSRAAYLVKVPFLDRSDTGDQAMVFTPDVASENPTRPICHLWLRVTSVLGDLVFCSVCEAPDELHLNKGASFVVASEWIEDWMINNGGEVFGGFSLRVIRSRLREPERVRFDEHTGIREFKDLIP
jgi:uncharacterized protein YegJ (DUF2314 family)